MSFEINEFAQEGSRQLGLLQTQLLDYGREPTLYLLEEKAKTLPLTEAETTMLNKLKTSNSRNSAGAHQLKDRYVQERIFLLFSHIKKEMLIAAPRSTSNEDNISQVTVFVFGFVCLFLSNGLKTTIETYMSIFDLNLSCNYNNQNKDTLFYSSTLQFQPEVIQLEEMGDDKIEKAEEKIEKQSFNPVRFFHNNYFCYHSVCIVFHLSHT